MLRKNEIIQELKNKEFLVSDAIYEYICRLHLYDDDEINEALIEYIQKNYKKINFVGLINSKLNQPIIECLIQILLKEKDWAYKKHIEDVLIEHYSYIKNLNYNFEELFKDEYNLLLYKKIKHFSKKEPEELIEKYIRNVKDYFYINEDDESSYTKEILIKAMGTALIQSEEGYRLLLGNCIELYEMMDEEKCEFMHEEMTWFVYPLCQAKRPEYFWLIFNLYTINMDFIAYKDNCDYYFSSICNKDFFEYYTDILGTLGKKEISDYFYDIAEYMDYKDIDDFLLNILKANPIQEIKENLIRILCSKFDKRVIPFAMQYVKKGDFIDEEGLKMALAPMLIINNYEDMDSKEIIKYAQNVILDMEQFEKEFKEKLTKKVVEGLQEVVYENNEKVKRYKELRKMFEKIVQDMMDYFEEGKFNWKIDYNKTKYNNKNNIKELFTSFDHSTQEGTQAFANIVIFKNACNMNCITEEFLQKNIYNEEEKNEMLQSMLNSEAGVFEILGTNIIEGEAILRNVFNGNKYVVTDLALSSNMNYQKIYLYTRVITYKDISFCSGLNIPFFKDDKFIQNWINEKKNANNQEQEITKFLELYNETQKNEHGIKSINRYLN